MTDRKRVAMKRWRVLVGTLSGKRRAPSVENEFSVRRFSSYGLLNTVHVPQSDQSADNCWYRYTCDIEERFQPLIRHVVDAFAPEDLLGFNNTGNVCVWPAEEVLAYYCMKHPELFANKRVIELGGGMTCLAGMAVALTTPASAVVLTDGNEKSVCNLQHTIERNATLGWDQPECVSKTESQNDSVKFKNCSVSCQVLRWDNEETVLSMKDAFDLVLCADCVFFEDGRQQLVDTLRTLIKPDGCVLIFAPKRGESFDEFVTLAKNVFDVKCEEFYDERVTSLHKDLLSRGIEAYDADIHYPLMLTLKLNTAISSVEKPLDCGP